MGPPCCRSWLVTLPSPYLMVDSEVQLSTPTTKAKGMGKASPIGWVHLYLSANFHKMLVTSIEKGVVSGWEGVGADFMSQNRHFMSWLHFIADCNSRKRTKNLGSDFFVNCRNTLLSCYTMLLFCFFSWTFLYYFPLSVPLYGTQISSGYLITKMVTTGNVLKFKVSPQSSCPWRHTSGIQIWSGKRNISLFNIYAFLYFNCSTTFLQESKVISDWVHRRGALKWFKLKWASFFRRIKKNSIL
jgi:hypothetical protein